MGTFATLLSKSGLGIALGPSENAFCAIFIFQHYFPFKSPLYPLKSGHMTKNGPILKQKNVLETGECTDHLSTMQNNTNLQCPVKNHPSHTECKKNND